MTEWQPISTAPKDGTSILAVEGFQREDDMGETVYPEDYAVVRWVVPKFKDVAPGWSSYGVFLVSFEPTHWMPLPNPPEVRA